MSLRPTPKRTHWVSLLVGLGLMYLSLNSLVQALAETPPVEIWQSLQTIPQSSIALALALTLLNYSILTAYDALAVRYAQHPLSYDKTAIAAIVGYGFSNNIGIAVLSGGTVRYRFYRRWGLSTGAIARAILFSSLCFWVGLCAVGGSLFVFAPEWVSGLLRLPTRMVRPLGSLSLGLLLGHLIYSAWGDFRGERRSLKLGQWVLPSLSLKLALGQLLVTLADWATVAAILYVLLPSEFLPAYPLFFGAYSLAKVATVASNVPGGLGVFEAVLLLALAWPSGDVHHFLGAMLAYRALYYLLPLGSAIALLGWTELKARQDE